MQRLNILKEFIDLFKLKVDFSSTQTEYVESTNFLIDNSCRSLNILDSVHTLIESCTDSLSTIEHSLGILLRSGLYDYINFSYYSNNCIAGEYFDGSKFEVSILNHSKGHFNRFEWNEELKKEYGDLVEFKENGKIKQFEELRVFPEAVNCAREKGLPILEVAVQAWQWYSKYEHYGYFTPKMLKYTKENEERIDYSIFLLMLNIVLSFMALKDFGVKISESEELLSEFEMLVDNYMKK